MRHGLRASSAFAPACCYTPALASPPHYTLTDIRSIPGAYATAVGNAGHVAGGFYGPPNGGAFIVGPSSLTLFNSVPEHGFHAHGVNSLGVAVGAHGRESHLTPTLMRPDGSFRDFSPFGGSFGIAYSINNGGWVVGSSNSSGDPDVFRAFQWRDGVQRALEVPPGVRHTLAAHITPEGFVVGKGDHAREEFVPVTWTDGHAGTLPLPDGFESAMLQGANDEGAIVGNAWNEPWVYSAHLWTGGVPSALVGFGGPTWASGVDATGLIAGTATVPGTFIDAGVIWQEGRMYRLDDLVEGRPRIIIYAATAISDNGCIVGAAVDGGDNSFAVLLTPVPAPGSLLVSTLWVVAQRRRRPAPPGSCNDLPRSRPVPCA